MNRESIVVTGSFDDLRSTHMRFLQEAARLSPVTVLLWSDELAGKLEGKKLKFPEGERSYLLQSIRFVQHVELVTRWDNLDQLPDSLCTDKIGTWAVTEKEHNRAKEEFCRKEGMTYRAIKDSELKGFPPQVPNGLGQRHPPAPKKVLVTGCYDWFHSGHVRFFEEASAYGELYVVVGNDANIRLLKGEHHPLIGQDERRYMVGSIRYVAKALISSGEGWLDAAPEIARIKPDIYAVNEDGDRGGKREFCAERGIEYLVLKRRPAPGLLQRTSTNLRGF